MKVCPMRLCAILLSDAANRLAMRRGALVALTVAGSDSSGGAGIQADLRAFATVGVHGACVVTAITAQNSRGVRSVHPLGVKEVEAQFDAVAQDMEPAWAKTGMLHDRRTVRAVAGRLSEYGIPFVVDPVAAATSGDSLSEPGILDAIRDELLPRATVVTPNVEEAAALLRGRRIASVREMKMAAEDLRELGPQAVLLKGGHLEGTVDVVDVLCSGPGTFEEFRHPRMTGAFHGTGCTLSALITGYLARGDALETAVSRAERVQRTTMASAYPVGSGALYLDHMAPLKLAGLRWEVARQVRLGARQLETMLTDEWLPEIGSNLGIYFFREVSRVMWTLVWLTPWLGCPFGILLPVAVVGLLADMSRWRDLLPLYAFLVVYSLSMILFYVNGRYRVPVIPILIVFAAAGLVWAVSALQSRNGYGLVLRLLPAIGVFLVANHNPYRRALNLNPGQGFYDLGIAYLEENQWEEAEASFLRCNEIGKELAPHRQGHPGDGVQVFDANRDSVERARGSAFDKRPVKFLGLLPCTLAVQVGVGVKPRIEEIDPVEVGVHDLSRGHLFLHDSLVQGMCGFVAQVFHVHGNSFDWGFGELPFLDSSCRSAPVRVSWGIAASPAAPRNVRTNRMLRA